VITTGPEGTGEGVTERSDAPLADEPQPGAIPNDMPADVPSGLPEGADEPDPLGASDADPDTDRGAMPGIPPEGSDEPFSDG
jgi:hypothetical protein